MSEKETKQKYRIIKKLDAGGMAEVFQAEMETVKGFKKTVAIKRIRPNLIKDDRFLKMFMDEAKLSLYLQHANIASIFDVGMSDEHFFIVMEFVEGFNLRNIMELLPVERLPINSAVYIIQNVCEALEYAHTLKDSSTGRSFNIVHRDISPPNILISIQGEIKLVDFGLAKASNQTEKSEPGIIKGKFSYLSPEAAAGLEVDHRTDIFASGIILFELITGQRLFLGENNAKTVQEVKEANIPALSEFIPNVPPELERILLKSLERDPEKRYLSASDMGDDLTRLLYKMGEAVTKRDIARLAIDAMEIRKKQEPSMLISKDSLLKDFIEEELNQIISFDEIEEEDFEEPGAAPIAFSNISSLPLANSTPLNILTDEPEPLTPYSLGVPKPITKTDSDNLSSSGKYVTPPSGSNTFKNAPISFERTSSGESDPTMKFKILLLLAALGGIGYLIYFFIIKG
jgi:eukaryotic-like serine/threonine-protein kinase